MILKATGAGRNCLEKMEVSGRGERGCQAENLQSTYMMNTHLGSLSYHTCWSRMLMRQKQRWIPPAVSPPSPARSTPYKAL